MRRKCVTAEMPLEEGVLSSQLVCGPDVRERLTVAQVLDSLTPPMRAALCWRRLKASSMRRLRCLEYTVGPCGRAEYRSRQFRRRWMAVQEEADHV